MKRKKKNHPLPKWFYTKRNWNGEQSVLLKPPNIHIVFAWLCPSHYSSIILFVLSECFPGSFCFLRQAGCAFKAIRGTCGWGRRLGKLYSLPNFKLQVNWGTGYMTKSWASGGQVHRSKDNLIDKECLGVIGSCVLNKLRVWGYVR